jgi:hypothetical protein
MSHFVESSTPNEGLRSLLCQQACRKLVTEDNFEAKHGGFSQRTGMITRILFPRGAAMLADVAQVFVPFEPILS